MSPSPPLRKIGKDAHLSRSPDFGLKTNLLSVPSRPLWTVAKRWRISLPLQLRGQWRNRTALPVTPAHHRYQKKESDSQEHKKNALDLL